MEKLLQAAESFLTLRKYGVKKSLNKNAKNFSLIESIVVRRD